MSLILISLFVLIGCGTSEDEQQLTVFAASSLTNAFEEMQHDFEQEYPDIKLTMNFAGSQVLATQLGQGAEADVFASANEIQMDVAIEEGVISGEPVVFARNQLVIIVPDENPANIQQPADLANSGVKLVLGVESVPIGEYSRIAIESMDQSGEYGPEFLQKVKGNVVTLESNVLQIVAKIQLGEADAGIVYRTDVTEDLTGDVSIVEIPIEFNVEAVYPVAAVQAGNQELVRLFIDYLLSSSGQSVLASYGFTTEPQQ